MKYKLLSFICLFSFVEKGFATSFIREDSDGLISGNVREPVDGEDSGAPQNPLSDLSGRRNSSPRNGSGFSSRASSSIAPYEVEPLTRGMPLQDYSNTVADFSLAVRSYNAGKVGRDTQGDGTQGDTTRVPKLVINTSNSSLTASSPAGSPTTQSSPLRTSRRLLVVSFTGDQDSSAT